jgi:hypothetical protein
MSYLLLGLVFGAVSGSCVTLLVVAKVEGRR